MLEPGARTSSNTPVFEKSDTMSDFVVEPTDTAFGEQAGYDMPLE